MNVNPVSCVVALEPNGNQELDVSSLIYSIESEISWYIVNISQEELSEAVKIEDVNAKHSELMDEADNFSDWQELYTKVWEEMVTKAGYKFIKLTGDPFLLYSTLY